MTLLADATTGPGWVHFLPIATTLIAAAFVAVLIRRATMRRWAPHLVWWAVGVFFYGVGTALESTITLRAAAGLQGNTPALNQAWYWAGAILGGYPLATGSLYLLAPKRVAHVLTAISLAFVVFASGAVLLSPVDGAAIAAESHKPSGKFIEWQWVRLLTPFINLYAAAFLIGGAVYSSVRFAFPPRMRTAVADGAAERLDRRPRDGRRALGTGLIAFGALLPGIGGSLAKADIVEALYVGELLGLILIWAGYEACIRGPKPAAAEATAPADAAAAPA